MEWPDDRRAIELGGDRHTYLSFIYLACELAALPAVRYRDSANIVARLTLLSMDYAPAERVAVYAAAVRGLTTLEPSLDKQLKYWTSSASILHFARHSFNSLNLLMYQIYLIRLA